MNYIHLLVDYKGHFGSKNDSDYYRSGMNINLLNHFFCERGFELKIMKFSNVDFRHYNWKNQVVIYTSQEDPGFLYKSFIEDIVYGLELAGAIVIPRYKFLRSNNNKVFMEILRDNSKLDLIKNIKSNHYGSFDEFIESNFSFDQILVIKKAEGATSSGVFLGNDKKNILRYTKKVSSSPFCIDNLKDMIRPYIHKNYKKNSRNRKKFITQNFVSGLKNDWKILVFGRKYFLEYRGVRTNDFRASGSHKFFLNENIPDDIPNGIFNFAEKIRNTLNTPHLSLDIGFINGSFFLFEFQALYFSSYAHQKSTCYYEKIDDEFKKIDRKITLEKLYADSVCDFIEKKF